MSVRHALQLLDALAASEGWPVDVHEKLEAIVRAAGSDPTPVTRPSGSPPVRGEPQREVPDSSRLLGVGGMGEVWAVDEPELDRIVALKCLRSGEDDGELEAAFLREARLTASLEHPGIVPVHRAGRLEDGRPFYAMRRVRGEPLARWARRPDIGPDAVLDVLRKVAEAVGYAHARGVVHGDLKPANVMVGDHGEALVIDWGVARRIGEPGDAGTPGYRAPEQTAGARWTPRMDVYALGVMIAQAVTASGDHPEVRRLAASCCDADPARRPEHAGLIAQALSTWARLEERRQMALELVEQAHARLPRVEALDVRARELESRARDLAESGNPSDAPRIWTLEDDAKACSRERASVVVEIEQLAHSALVLSPELPQATDLLADSYRRRFERAERGNDDLAAEYAQRLRAYDRTGLHERWLDAGARLSVDADAPGTHVRLERFVERDRRLVAEPVADLGPTPIREEQVPRGSLLLVLEAPERRPTRLPLSLEREEHHDLGVVHLPRPGPGCYVPAGWSTIGGDEDAPESLPETRLWIEGFLIEEKPASVADYLQFLQTLADPDPFNPPVDPAAPDARLFVRHEGRLALRSTMLDRGWQLDWPMAHLSWNAATAYARWRRERDGLQWRLPDEWEWEKAVRGVDGRPWPWGSHFEPSWVCTAAGATGKPIQEPVGSYPVDRSPYGVLGAVGHVRDHCRNRFRRLGPVLHEGRLVADAHEIGDDQRVLRGGTVHSERQVCRPATRYASPPDRWWTSAGVRLVCPVGQTGSSSA